VEIIIERERENEKRKTIPWNPSGIWIYLFLGSQVASLQEAWDFSGWNL
jgi:hypothetical protein